MTPPNHAAAETARACTGITRRGLANGLAGIAALSAVPAMLAVTGVSARAHAAAAVGPLERLYALNAGFAVAPSRAVYTPGDTQAGPITLPCHAYLIRRAGEWILWDTGTDDQVSMESGGRIIAHELRGIVTWRIADQLAAIGIVPADIRHVVLSHAHFDHVGNARLFGDATWHLQRREWEAMTGDRPDDYGYDPALYAGLREADLRLVDGDADLFGDGSVRMIATPGHTPGHASLLLAMPRTGLVILSADVAHSWHNFENRIAPEMNSSAEETRASIGKVAALMESEGAALWINHDMAQSSTTLHAPAFYD